MDLEVEMDLEVDMVDMAVMVDMVEVPWVVEVMDSASVQSVLVLVVAAADLEDLDSVVN